jgi:Fe-S cluster assembly iron-binding protein IscA
MSITLTDAAAQRVRQFLDREGGAALRLGVRKTGC